MRKWEESIGGEKKAALERMAEHAGGGRGGG